MRTLTLVAGSVASLALMLGSSDAGAQPYYGHYPAPGYYYYYPAPPPHHYYHHHYHHHYYHYYYASTYYTGPAAEYADAHSGYYASCTYHRRRNGRIGAVLGAVGGGIIAAAATAAVPAWVFVGAGAGSLFGALIGHHTHPYPCLPPP